MPHTLEKQAVAAGPAILPSRRKACAKGTLIDPDARDGTITSAGPTLMIPIQSVSSAPADIEARRCTAPFTERPSLAITQAICDYRGARALMVRSIWARTPMRCRARRSGARSRCWPPNAVETIIQRDDGVTPTPVISRAILGYNRGARTPSRGWDRDHAVPQSPWKTVVSSTTHLTAGPADTDVTDWVQNGANDLLRSGK